MGRESKIIVTDVDVEDCFKIDECFGWELISIAVKGNDTCVALSRDTASSKYPKLVENEKKYIGLKAEISKEKHNIIYKQSKVNKFVAFLCFLLFIIPGFIYLSVKRKQADAEYAEKNKQSLEKIKALEDEANKVCNDSREFFLYM